MPIITLLELDAEVEAAGLAAPVLEPELPEGPADLVVEVTVVPGPVLAAPVAALAVVLTLLAGAGAGAVLLAKIMN